MPRSPSDPRPRACVSVSGEFYTQLRQAVQRARKREPDLCLSTFVERIVRLTLDPAERS